MGMHYACNGENNIRLSKQYIELIWQGIFFWSSRVEVDLPSIERLCRPEGGQESALRKKTYL